MSRCADIKRRLQQVRFEALLPGPLGRYCLKISHFVFGLHGPTAQPTRIYTRFISSNSTAPRSPHLDVSSPTAPVSSGQERYCDDKCQIGRASCRERV